MYLICLWRCPGKSISSAAFAYFHESTLLDRLPVAPGMETTIRKAAGEENKEGKEEVKNQKEEEGQDPPEVRVLVQAYYHNTNSFVVSRSSSELGNSQGQSIPPQNPNGKDDTKGEENPASSSPSSIAPLWTVPACELVPAPSAKFYPILETLMVRGDQTAQQATQFFQSETTKTFLTKAQETIQTKIATTAASLGGPEGQNGETRLKDLTDSLEAVVSSHTPSEPQIKQVLSIVKDQELTQLLQDCRERLEHLVQYEIPNATKVALLKTGIQIKMDVGDVDDDVAGDEEDNTDSASKAKATFVASMNASRKAALDSVRELLDQANVDASQLQQVQTDVTLQFSQTFDALATAAKSDRSLNDLFQSVADKTTVWQQSTGRLLETRSSSLFLEGASRLQARAAVIFQMQWTGGGEIGSKLTKAFTEKDAALARLKSIELGDAVKKRLVEAIEVRSDSLGGLDGIIAEALARVRTTGQQSGDKMKAMLSNLQASASTVTADAHETLISVLSHRSMYRDVALLRIERVFCELQSHLGDDLSPEDIAAVARGEGGTAKLFQPIAKRAVQQIEKQLDAAESQISDQTMLGVLQRVRQITSGELTVAALTEELVGILNDERIVSASETFVQHGEHVLDAIEGVSSSKVVNDALKIAEKAGITKDSVMKEFEKLDVDQLLDTAGSAVTDEKKRLQLLSSATDTALDFILRILPSMPVPPFDGARDGLVYNISNLSLEGFKVRKEDIQIELAGMRATKRGSSPIIKNGRSMEEEGLEKTVSAVDNDDDETVPSMSQESDTSQEVVAFDQISSNVKATELLIIDVRRISAILNNAAWRFEQTYLPYWKGSGLADVTLSDGAIRLQFELRRRVKASSSDTEEVAWEPVLCLHDRTCSIGEVELVLQGEGRLTWIFNKLASIFKGALRDYVVRTIVRVLTKQSGWILGELNTVLSPYWDLILKTANLKMEDLVEADDEVVVKADATANNMLVELVWWERLPLGMNLLTNDESGQLKVVDFPRGTQARLVCEKRNLTPEVFKGATIVAVNGTTSDNQDELFDALKDPARPKTILFRLAESEEWERVRRFIEGNRTPLPEQDNPTKPRELTTRVVDFHHDGELGIVFAPALDNCGLVVDSFLEGENGLVLDAERSNDIHLGDLLTHVNGHLVVGTKEGTQKSLQILEEMASNRPLSLTFSRSYMYRQVILKPEDVPGLYSKGGPEELVLAEQKLDDGTRRVVIDGFNPVTGAGETSGILIGDHLVFVNGTPVGAGARWLGEAQSPTVDDLYEMLCDKTLYPIGLTFARPQTQGGLSSGSRWSKSSKQHKQHRTEPFSDFDADTICVTCDQQNHLGCIFDTTEHGDIVISGFSLVPGLFHRQLSRYNDIEGRLRIAIDSINGQFVPSYVTKDMVMNALNRSWKNDKRVEIVLCDDERKQYIQSLT